jgi:hypothetical protein
VLQQKLNLSVSLWMLNNGFFVHGYPLYHFNMISLEDEGLISRAHATISRRMARFGRIVRPHGTFTEGILATPI